MGKSKKRKHSKDSRYYILKKIRKLEEKIKRKYGDTSSSSEYSEGEYSNHSGDHIPETPNVRSPSLPPITKEPILPTDKPSNEKDREGTTTDDPPNSNDQSNVFSETPPDIMKESEVEIPAVEQDILEILGEDPSKIEKHGSDFHTEIATRFQYWSTLGINKENRKELNEKYLIPRNCPCINAPLINPEIKAALSDTVVKRDKGIEAKQKQLASAISCVGGAISHLINSKEKDNVLLGQLTDAGRLLCDLQYTESITRRNFVFYSVKKEFKDQLLTTKIDKHLFGENLADTLKTAKAVSKSAAEMKDDTSPSIKTQKKTEKPLASRDLNSKAPVPLRRQSGPIRSSGPASRHH
ncbi:uncharacterized protein LOC130671954 [Microplitis mediator]|uniref:uncharacterized protein LOC130671954 n=1 Tax=Microplitis mediator TaxID=375433 RepID=UPI002555F3FE|nr:uncharacterized protein LOC130671954 [Microplitis mediator]